MIKENVDTYWDSTINEYEIDPSWKEHPVYKNSKYQNYRKNWSKAAKGEFLDSFPLNMEIEPTYYCNLKCPMCPREVGKDERKTKHMPMDVWDKILTESKENKLNSIQLSHEAESLMNPQVFNFMKQANEAGIFDIWIHTNGLMLTEDKARKFINSGLKKINFSIDAFNDESYEKIRVGGKLDKLKKNIFNFLKIKKEMKADYLRVRVSFVEQKDNFGEKEDFFRFWSKQDGINVITFQRGLDFSPFEKVDEDVGLSEKELEKKYSDKDPFFCGQPWETPVIQEDGKISPCGMPVRKHNEDFFIGDLSKGDTIKESWNSDKMKKLREIHKKKEWYKVNMCRVCSKVCKTSQHKEFKPN